MVSGARKKPKELAKSQTLCAFYDFAVSRISFDYFGFLVMAEFARTFHNMEVLHLVLVPAEGDGFHPNVLYDLKQKEWRLRNIVIPGLALIPGRTQLTICSSRSQAQEIFDKVRDPIFPERYMPDAPVAKWHCSWTTLYGALGRDVQVLRSPAQALQYIKNWADTQKVGRGVVSITIRNASFNKHKNTDAKIWAKVAHKLYEMGYFPILIPDTDIALLDPDDCFDGLRFMPEAAMNLELRMALYEFSFLNLCMSNGIATICHYNKYAKFIQFLSGNYLVDNLQTEDDTGTPFGTTQPYLNHFQKMVWRQHTVENIVSEFQLMASKIEEAIDTKQLSQCYEVNPQYSLSLIELLRLFFRNEKWEQFDETAKELLKTENDRAETYYLIGCAEIKKEESSENGSRAKTEQALYNAVRIGKQEIRRNNLTYTLCEVVGKGLEILGRGEEAQIFLESCVDEKSEIFMPYKLLAKNYLSSNKREHAIECYLKALDNGITENEIYLELGQIFTELGILDNAIQCFQHLVSIGFRDVEVYLKLGLIHEAQDNLTAAIVVYQNAINVNIGDERIVYRLDTLLDHERNSRVRLTHDHIGVSGQYNGRPTVGSLV